MDSFVTHFATIWRFLGGLHIGQHLAVVGARLIPPPYILYNIFKERISIWCVKATQKPHKHQIYFFNRLLTLLLYLFCALGGIQTPNPQIRSLVLYSVELREHIFYFISVFPAGVEPTTSALEVPCSIQLSYGNILKNPVILRIKRINQWRCLFAYILHKGYSILPLDQRGKHTAYKTSGKA